MGKIGDMLSDIEEEIEEVLSRREAGTEEVDSYGTDTVDDDY